MLLLFLRAFLNFSLPPAIAIAISAVAAATVTAVVTAASSAAPPPCANISVLAVVGWVLRLCGGEMREGARCMREQKRRVRVKA